MGKSMNGATGAAPESSQAVTFAPLVTPLALVHGEKFKPVKFPASPAGVSFAE
jgi:hypothetical protein